MTVLIPFNLIQKSLRYFIEIFNFRDISILVNTTPYLARASAELEYLEYSWKTILNTLAPNEEPDVNFATKNSQGILLR